MSVALRLGIMLSAVSAGMSVVDTVQAQTAPRQYRTEKAEIAIDTVVSGLVNPWSLAFMPDGRMLVTERPGRLRIITLSGNEGAGQMSPALSGLPAVAARGQGGLLDVVIDPAFSENRQIYLCFAESRSGGSATSVARARLNLAGTALEAVQVIFRQEPVGTTSRHFGCRLVFARDGAIFVTMGDRGDLSDSAQDKGSLVGKVARIRTDGAIPGDNPFVGQAGVRPEIWSLGHRNAQGAALHPTTGQLWTIEHGSRGGDEINTPKKGLNYGWPVITYGIDYSGAKIGEGTAKPGLEQPVFYWDPSIAPSGAAFYTADRFPGWRGSLFTGALVGQMLVRLELSGERVVREERMLTELGERIRDVRQGPDGFLYLLTDAANGKLLRVRPTAPRS